MWLSADLANYETAGAKAGNGGFFFSCYLGSYFNSNFASTNAAQVPRPMSGEPPRYRCHLGCILPVLSQYTPPSYLILFFQECQQ